MDYGWLIKHIIGTEDDLYGFELDVYHRLVDEPGLSNLQVCRTDDPNHLIQASFDFDKTMLISQVENLLRSLWLDRLRYAEFEIHDIERTPNSVALNFCTRAGGLGVTGKITASQLPV